MKQYKYVIRILTNAGDIFYLTSVNESLNLSKDYNKAMLFDDSYKASSFAREYFKNYNHWSVSALEYNVA